MKSIVSISFFFLFGIFIAQSQVLEETRVMSTGSQPALTILLPGANTKFVESEWKEYVKPYGKVTRIKSAKETVLADVQVLDIGGVNRLNIYNLAEEVSGGSKMVVWFDLGTGFISSEAYPREYVAAVKFLKDFAAKVKVDQITLELEEQEKLLDKAENSLTKLQRENESLHKIIEDSKKRIAQAEEDIKKNLNDQEVAQRELGAQQEAVKTVQKKLDECKKE
jgi:hypothetical protein